MKITEEIKKIIEENIAALASVNESGKPHTIAVAYPKVISENQILITDNFMKETIQNIQKIIIFH